MELTKEEKAFIKGVKQLYEALYQSFYGDSKHQLSEKWHAIPTNQFFLDILYKQVLYMRKNRMPIRFLDIGCGKGNILSFMRAIEVTDITGVEVDNLECICDKRYILNGNIFEEKFDKIIENSTLIYMYQPQKQHVNKEVCQMRKLLNHVLQHAKIGSVLVLNYVDLCGMHEYLEETSPNVYVLKNRPKDTKSNLLNESKQ